MISKSLKESWDQKYWEPLVQTTVSKIFFYFKL